MTVLGEPDLAALGALWDEGYLLGAHGTRF
jgi:hypothetical protein